MRMTIDRQFVPGSEKIPSSQRVAEKKRLKDNRFLCPAWVGGHAISALFDTGAMRSVIDKKLVRKAKLTTVEGPKVRISVANGQSLVLDQYVKVPFHLRNHGPWDLEALVMDGLVYDLILGVPFMFENQVWLGCFPTLQIMIRHPSRKEYPLLLQASGRMAEGRIRQRNPG